MILTTEGLGNSHVCFKYLVYYRTRPVTLNEKCGDALETKSAKSALKIKSANIVFGVYVTTPKLNGRI